MENRSLVELPRYLMKVEAFCCHPTTTIRRFVDKAGHSHFKRQCTTCGLSTGTSISSADVASVTAPEKIEAWDDGITIRYEQARRGREEVEKAEWRLRYDAYLRTSEWRARRKLVFKRARGVCEGCLVAKATQVHHLRYDNLENEFMWELVAICNDCHRRIHGDNHNP